MLIGAKLPASGPLHAGIAQHAAALERAGFDSLWVSDHIVMPRTIASRYPFAADGRATFPTDTPFVDALIALAVAAGVTSRVRLGTAALVLPQRNPVLVAKQAASVAVITGNRFGFGVGLSPWPEDYIACGQPWERRGKRMDEQIEIIQQLAAGGFVEYHGEFYDLPAVKICPTPTEKLPILIGGHADAALKRAARLCDGWMHAGSEGDRLPEMIARLEELRREYGREDEPFEIHVISLDGYSADGCRRLEELGVTDVIIGFRNAYQMEQDTETLQQKIDAMKWFADSVISEVKG